MTNLQPFLALPGAWTILLIVVFALYASGNSFAVGYVLGRKGRVA